MSPRAALPYSTKKLAYCAGLVAVVYWLPFAYLAVYDPQDLGRGGMALCISVLITVPAFFVSGVELVKAMKHYRDAGPPPPVLAMLLFGVTISPFVLFFFGMLRNA